ncbi:MAG TPA: phosphotransferase, partial [Umezawaea sp.]|nr:phosphotransferase [Umezawaea sp.]
MWRRIPIGDQVLGKPRKVRGIGSSPRSRVWSAEIGGTPVVVKQAVGGSDAGVRYERELTALRLAERAEPQLAPRVLAVEPEQRIMVLERLPVRRWTMPNWVVYAEGLAGLHQVTTAADVDVLPPAEVPTPSDLDAFRRFSAEFGLTTPDDELESLPERLSGGYDLVHGDPCVGNALPVDGRAWFLDFEHAALGNGLTELAYLRIGFPTCWNLNVVSPGQVA